MGHDAQQSLHTHTPRSTPYTTTPRAQTRTNRAHNASHAWPKHRSGESGVWCVRPRARERPLGWWSARPGLDGRRGAHATRGRERCGAARATRLSRPKGGRERHRVVQEGHPKRLGRRYSRIMAPARRKGGGGWALGRARPVEQVRGGVRAGGGAEGVTSALLRRPRSRPRK